MLYDRHADLYLEARRKTMAVLTPFVVHRALDGTRGQDHG